MGRDLTERAYPYCFQVALLEFKQRKTNDENINDFIPRKCKEFRRNRISTALQFGYDAMMSFHPIETIHPRRRVKEINFIHGLD